MLSIKNSKIFDKKGKEIKLHGINLGGWLIMEGYTLGGPNVPESSFKKKLENEAGKELADEFTDEFRKRFITEKDFKIIKKTGFNCVRLPFNYKILESEKGLAFLINSVKKITKQKLFIILDMHAVPGSQNPEWHADSTGAARFWEDKSLRGKYIKLWKRLSDIFKNNPWVAAYDLMNEPVTEKTDILKEIYLETIETIRKNNDQHILFLEGSNFARNFDFLEDVEDENTAYSFHFYTPMEVTFNLNPLVAYPGQIKGKLCDKKALRKELKKYFDLSKRTKKPVLVGEFGTFLRCPKCGHEFEWVKDVLEIFDEFDFHWTYWTYKVVVGENFPNGLFQCPDIDKILTHHLEEKGLNKILELIKNKKGGFYKLLDTANFIENPFLSKAIKNFL